jgi:hypothetical protein
MGKVQLEQRGLSPMNTLAMDDLPTPAQPWNTLHWEVSFEYSFKGFDFSQGLHQGCWISQQVSFRAKNPIRVSLKSLSVG